MSAWNRDSVKAKLSEHGWGFQERSIEHGVQYALPDGTRVNCYDTGRVVVQGKKESPLRQTAETVFGGGASEQAVVDASVVSAPRGIYSPTPAVTPTRVFIVYGHDADAREQLELLLRRLKLEPIVLQNLPGGGDTIIEKLEQLTHADFACVLVTPDDEGRKRKNGDSVPLSQRARQNVVLELGMVLARLGRRRVAILLKGNDIEKPSDIDGLIYLRFTGHVGEVKNDLAANLQEAGFTIQVKDLLP